jgi:ubiquinone/menaquinone biosynthesis C-methylase UbiE
MEPRRVVSGSLTAILILVAPALAVQQDASPQAVSPEEIHAFKPQSVPLGPIEAEGLILDIGGGEGVISHLMGSQVVAIDVSRDRLGKRQVESLRIVMDARELSFVDGSFDTATAFFALLPFDPPDQVKVLEEAHRVLAPGGRLLIWDAVFGPRPEGKQVAMIPVAVKIKGENIETGFSRRWPDEVQDLDHYRGLAEAAGFTVVEVDQKAAWFRLVLQKPGPEPAEPEPTE